jgi:hypothetical protein
VPRDYESHVWSLGEDSWDLIHVQQACGSVSSWPELYQKIYQYEKRHMIRLARVRAIAANMHAGT